jgi:hypothetical protein
MQTERMDTAQWIGHVDDLRNRGGLLAFGEWHGYTTDPMHDGPPMRGYYYLVRWAKPTIAVSHDDPAEVVELAKSIERGLEVHRQFAGGDRP